MVDDPLMSISDADPTSVCLVDGPRTLVVDLEYGSRNWVCFPACIQSFGTDASLIRSQRNVGLENQGLSNNTNFATKYVPDANLGHNFFSAMPPTRNVEETNSFVYCPILLHVAGLLHANAASAWGAAAP